MACGAFALPALLALTSAFLFALGSQLSRLSLRHMPPSRVAFTEIAASTLLYWVFAPFFVEASYWLMPAVVLFVLAGLVRPFLSARLAIAGTKHLGPTLSSTLQGTSPLFGVSLGVLALGENLTPAALIGTAGVISGVTLLSWRGETRAGWPLWALLLPVGAALVRALANMISKLGMETLASPFFVGLVAYTVSMAIFMVIAPPPRERGLLANPGFKWAALTGSIYAISVLSLNVALKCGTLVVVSPIVACSPVFTLLLGLTLFREETIDRRVIGTVLLVVPSVILITLGG